MELPTVLMIALNSLYKFKGKTLWNISEGLKQVKVELTFLLADEPTDQPARAVKRKQRQRQPSPTPAPRLPEPTAEPTPQRSPPKQAPSSTPKKRAPTPSPAKPPATNKLMTTSTPIPEPMEVIPSDQPDELNRAFTQPALTPTADERRKVTFSGYSYEQPAKFNLRRVFRHPVDNDTLTVIEATHKKKEKTCFYVHCASSPDLAYYQFKPPRTKSHIHVPEWRDYLVGIPESTTPLRYNESSMIKSAFKTLIKKRDGTMGRFLKTEPPRSRPQNW